MALTDISHSHLYRAPWNGLVRLGRSLGVRVPIDEPETDGNRMALVDAVKRSMTETMLAWCGRKRKKRGAVEGYVVRDSRASAEG
jgi:hypothetical protein